MEGWVMVAKLHRWWQNFVITRRANKIAAGAVDECWTKVRLKTVSLSPSEVADYMRKHSAAVVHHHVDSLVQDDPCFDSGNANHLIVKATERLVSLLSKRLAKQARRMPRAA
jgi:hypothetical protein